MADILIMTKRQKAAKNKGTKGPITQQIFGHRIALMKGEAISS
jgi:hypothetical protein